MAIENIREIPDGQLPPIDPNNRKPSDFVIEGAKEIDPEWAEEMEFLKEPVTIRILPPNERNPVPWVFCGVNGQLEAFINNRWETIKPPYLPVNIEVTVRRMYLEVLLRSRVTRIRTNYDLTHGGEPDHNIYRETTGVYSVDIIQDKNELGAAWMTAIRRQSF